MPPRKAKKWTVPLDVNAPESTAAAPAAESKKKRTYTRRKKVQVGPLNGALVGLGLPTAVPQDFWKTQINGAAESLQLNPEQLHEAAGALNRAKVLEQRELEKSVDLNFDGETLALFDSYEEARHRGVLTKRFLKQLNALEKAGKGTPEMTSDLLEHLHAQLPALSKDQKFVLERYGLMLLGKARPVQYQAESVQCETFLSLYSFSTSDTGPFFPIKELFLKLDSQLRRLGASWDDMDKFPRLHNPVYLKGVDVPEYLEFVAAQRVYKWYQCFEKYCHYLQTLKPRQRAAWQQIDMLLFPVQVSEHDQTFLTQLYGYVRSATSLAKWAVKNQLFIMIVRNMLCIGVALFLVRYMGRNLDARRFLLDLLLGQFLEDMWRQWTALISWAGIKWLDLKAFGPLGDMLAKFFAMMSGVGAPNLIKLGALTGVGVFGSGWIAGLAFLGLQETLFEALGLGSVASIMLMAADSLYDLFVQSVTRDAASISTLFAIHGVKYVCALMGFPSDGWCQAFADRISYALQGISVGVMLFDIIADIRFFARVYSKPNLKASDLEAMGRNLSCVRALYGWSRSDVPIDLPPPT